MVDIGFLYYYIVATMCDIDDRLQAKGDLIVQEIRYTVDLV